MKAAASRPKALEAAARKKEAVSRCNCMSTNKMLNLNRTIEKLKERLLTNESWNGNAPQSLKKNEE